MVICSPTGSGKTILTAYMLKRASEKGLRSWFLVHRRELIKQSVKSFTDVGVAHSVIAAGQRYCGNALVQIASVQTLSRRLGRIVKPDLIVTDEAHHVVAKTWANVIKACPDAFHVGLTATPCRLDGRGLDAYFDDLILGPTPGELMERGILSRYRAFAPATCDLSGLHSRGGDYAKNELDAAVRASTVTGDAVREYLKRARGRKAIVFCVSIAHSKDTVRRFVQAGIAAEHVDGETQEKDRDAAVARFARGETTVLSNVDLFGEGFDIPDAEVAILLRPTKSFALYRQQVGRVLRGVPGKVALIHDHAGCIRQHGLPDDPVEWTLKGVEKRESSASTVRICGECYCAFSISERSCPDCGWEIPVVAQRVVEVAPGDLEEIDPALLRQQRNIEQGQARTLAELTELGKKRGYGNPYGWAINIIKARERKRGAVS